jgi:hypothetical protein
MLPLISSHSRNLEVIQQILSAKYRTLELFDSASKLTIWPIFLYTFKPFGLLFLT